MKHNLVFGLLLLICISSYSQNLDVVVTIKEDSQACKIDSITESALCAQIKTSGNVNWMQTIYNKNDIYLFKYGEIDPSKYSFNEGNSKIIGPAQTVYPDNNSNKTSLKNASNEDLDFYLVKAKKTKKIGTVMSIAGPLAATLGGLLAASSFNPNPFVEDATSKGFNFGAGLFLTGMGVTILGLPILVTGSSRVKNINEIKRSRGMTMELIPGSYYNYQANNYQPYATIRITF